MKRSIVTILVIMAITTAYGQNQTLPMKWEAGMKLESRYSGGMTEYAYDLSITDSESYLIVKGEHARTVKKKFSSKELNDVLAFLREHNFEKIKSEHTGPTNDKASESVVLIWEEIYIGASEGTDLEIPDDQHDDFYAIQTHLLKLFGEE